MQRNYEKLNIKDFGHHLLDTGDLDPVYIALTKKGVFKSTAQLDRWLIAYWCFYHCGVASWLSEKAGESFWNWMGVAAKNETHAPPGESHRWPRGSERRHFRGQAAVNAVRHLQERYGKRPQNMVSYIRNIPGDSVPYTAVAKRAREHPLFGPWISFKIADMLERVLNVPVDFSEAEVFMFKDPVEAALMLWRQHEGLSSNARPRDSYARQRIITRVVAELTRMFGGMDAPPHWDRRVGLQEIETILCKWKSHMNGHYPLYNDINEIREGVVPWCKISPTARSFLAAMSCGDT